VFFIEAGVVALGMRGSPPAHERYFWRASEGLGIEPTGSDVADFGRRGVPVGNEEGDNPARDRHFGSLIGEYEEGAEDCRFVFEGLLEEAGFGVDVAAGDGAG